MPEAGKQCPKCGYIPLSDGGDGAIVCWGCDTEWNEEGDEISPVAEPEEE